MNSKKENTIITGEIVKLMPNTMFRVRVLEDDREIIGVPSGKMRRGFMKLMPGQRVKVEMTPYDANRGRIVGKA